MIRITVKKLQKFRIALLQTIQQYRECKHTLGKDNCPLCKIVLNKQYEGCQDCIYNILFPARKTENIYERCANMNAPELVASSFLPDKKGNLRADWIEFKVIPKLDKIIKKTNKEKK